MLCPKLNILSFHLISFVFILSEKRPPSTMQKTDVNEKDESGFHNYLHYNIMRNFLFPCVTEIRKDAVELTSI